MGPGYLGPIAVSSVSNQGAMKNLTRHIAILTITSVLTMSANLSAQPRITIANGTLEGALDEATGIRSFKGIPFAAPPVGNLRWQPPKPATDWEGVRGAKKFGNHGMQIPVFGDMGHRTDGMSEDCLYLNVWTPAKSADEKLPVLLYFYGGGFVCGDGSERRYDGAAMAKQGIVALTCNYRLGPFGFMAHPELTKESPHNASGNYGLLDQSAAIKWVKDNIVAFGGDPERITIAGESAGSVSVSAQMASPLSRDSIAGAIGESGAIIGTLSAIPLAEAEQRGVDLATKLGDGTPLTLAELRAIPAEELLQRTSRAGAVWFNPVIDGWFLPKSPTEIFAAGEQANVPLLAGVNSQEMAYQGVLGREQPTPENYRAALKRLYPDHTEKVLQLYPATTNEEVMDAAQDLAGDRFISYGTWRWAELCSRTGTSPVYYYLFSRVHPVGPDAPFAPRGAPHASEIDYAMGNLELTQAHPWKKEDHQVSHTMHGYFANFIKTGNPNGEGLADWPEFKTGKQQVIDVRTGPASMEQLRQRYDFLAPFYLKQ